VINISTWCRWRRRT